MGKAVTMLMIMLCMNIFLAMAFPSAFSLTETIQHLQDIGLNVTYNSTEDSYLIINNDTNQTNAKDQLGVGDSSGGSLWSSVTSFISDIVQASVGFILWILKFMFAPITVMNQSGAPWQIQLVIALPMVVLYYAGIFDAWSGRDS